MLRRKTVLDKREAWVYRDKFTTEVIWRILKHKDAYSKQNSFCI